MNRKKREKLILDAAVVVFSRQGYHETSVSEIIQEAQVARGTFYLYFKNKSDLCHALMEHFFMEINRAIAKMQNMPAGNPQEHMAHIRHAASDLVLAITRDKMLTRMLLCEASQWDSELSAKLALFYDQTSRLLSQKLEAQMAQGLIRPGSSDVIARCILGSVKELVIQWISQDSTEIEPAIHGLIDYLVAGLVPQSVVSESAEEIQNVPAPRQNNMGELH